jgi:hypothetical protein
MRKRSFTAASMFRMVSVAMAANVFHFCVQSLYSMSALHASLRRKPWFRPLPPPVSSHKTQLPRHILAPKDAQLDEPAQGVCYGSVMLSMIMVIDGARVVLFDGLPASASRLL